MSCIPKAMSCQPKQLPAPVAAAAAGILILAFVAASAFSDDPCTSDRGTHAVASNASCGTMDSCPGPYPCTAVDTVNPAAVRPDGEPPAIEEPGGSRQ